MHIEYECFIRQGGRLGQVASLGVLLAVLSASGGAQAETVITFSDNTSPLASYPSTGTNAGPFTTPFATSMEYRMVMPFGPSVGGGGEKDVIFGTGNESWTFDDNGVLTAVGAGMPSNSGANNPPSPVAPNPGTNPALQQAAPFFGGDFTFLAPIQGSLAGVAYGAGTTNYSAGATSFIISYPVLEAQWGGTYFPLGQEDDGVHGTGVTFNCNAVGHDVVCTAEHIIQVAEDPGSAGFSSWTGQWELHGAVDISPVGQTVSTSVLTGANITFTADQLAVDADGDALSITAVDVSGLTNGTVDTTGLPGSIVYTTAVAGAETFTVDLIANGRTTTATVTMTASTDTVPIANDDAAITVQGQAVTTNVVANDVDTNLDSTSVAIVGSPANGALTNNGDGTITYTPNAGFTGTDTYTYTVDDASSQTSAAATVTVVVNASTPSTTGGPVTAANTNGLGVVRVSAANLDAAGIPTDAGVEVSCTPDCFDFVASANGGTMVVVLPLSSGLPAGAEYRKFVGGAWQAFDISAGDTVKSAAGVLNDCPPPGSGDYKSPMQQGHLCIELTIADGGLNDSDSIGGQVTDPGGPAVPVTSGPAVAPPGEKISGGACTITTVPVNPAERADWWLVGSFLLLLGVVRRRLIRRQR